jgi:YD repeat-containing protein
MPEALSQQGTAMSVKLTLVGRPGTTATQTGTLLTLTLSLTPTQVALTTVGDEWTAVWAYQGSLYSRAIAANGSLAGSTQTLFPAVGQQQAPAVAGNDQDRYLVGWQAPLTTTEAIYAGLVGGEAAGPGGLQTTTIHYDYDPLSRLRAATYTGIFSGTYAYSYDALGNRLTYSTNVTASKTITHTYDVANRLQQSVDQDGLITTYDWDAAGRLLTTTVDSQASRVYGYNQRGHLLQADVDGLLTTFAYDGDGNRLLMSVAGVVTTYTLDYGNGRQILLEEGSNSNSEIQKNK